MTIENDLILRNPDSGSNPELWPRLSCTVPNQVTLAASNPTLDPNATLFFPANGQLKAVANLRFLTGNPATEKLVILDNGNVGIGESSPITAKLVVNGNLKLQQGLAVNEFSSDGTLTDNSDLAIPTEKAVKTYINTQLTTVNTTLANKADKAGSLTQDFQTKNLTLQENIAFQANGQLKVTGDLHVFVGNPATEKLTILANGNVGIGSTSPQAALDVVGTIKGKGILAGIWAAQPLTDVKIATSGWNWQDVADTSVSMVLDRDGIIFCTYSINVQPDGDSQGEWLSTRLMVDGTAHRSSGSHNQTYVAADTNLNLNGNLVIPIKAGSHIVKLQWMKPYNNVPTWSSFPSWGDGYIGGRTLVVMAFYQ